MYDLDDVNLDDLYELDDVNDLDLQAVENGLDLICMILMMREDIDIGVEN